MSEAFAVVIFGGASWLAAIIASTFCAGRKPYDDGPPPATVQSWLVAIAGACVGAGVAAHHPAMWQFAMATLVVTALAAAVASDLAIGIVPDLCTLLPLGVLLAGAAAQRNYGPLFSAIFVAVPFGAAALVSHGRGMGWGDVKLAALGGALLGLQESLLAFTLASAAVLVASRFSRMERGRPIAFGPYIASGIGAMLVFGSGL